MWWKIEGKRSRKKWRLELGELSYVGEQGRAISEIGVKYRIRIKNFMARRFMEIKMFP